MKRLWQKLLNAIPGGAFARSVLLIAGGSTLGQLIVIAASPILTRLYTPEYFGILGVYVASIMLLAGVSTLRYELAVPLPKNEDVAKILLQLALLLSFGFSILLLLVFAYKGKSILEFVGLSELAPYAYFLPLGTLLIASYQSLTYWAVRKGQYRTLAATKLWQGLGNVATQLVLGVFGVGALGLLAGDAAGRSAGISRLARGVPGIFRLPDFRQLRKVAFRYKKFPLWSTGSTLINRLGLQLPQLFMAATFGSREAGWYLLTQRVMGMPVNLIGQAVAQVFLNQIAEIKRERPDQAGAFYLGVVKRMALIGGIPILIGGLLLGELFGLIFGEGWTTAGRMVQILTPMFAAQWTFSPTSQILIVFEKQEVQLAWDVIRLISLGAVLVYARRVGLDPLFTVVGISVTMTLAYLLLGAMNYRAIQ